MEIDKISVIMGVYNCSSTLPKAIDSIINQTYTNWELIICDDASRDDTYNVAKQYQEKYPDKIVLIRNRVNSYLSFSLNHCLQYAKGQYIARMDGDDISLPDRFEKQILYLQSHPEVQLVGTAMQWFDEKNGPTRIIYKPKHTDKWTLHKESPFHHATIMTYKHVYDALGGYLVNKTTRRCEDYELWFRFFAYGFKGDNLYEALYLVREDENAISKRKFIGYWNAFLVAKEGYSLLGYPRRWLIPVFARTIIKGLTPQIVQIAYRNLRKKGNGRAILISESDLS